MRVLVVEDNAILAEVLSNALAQAGHEVIGPANSSAEAIQLAENEDPQIALVDLDLEKESIGLDVAEQLTGELDIEVIICTARPELARRASSGAMGLISKPFDL
ncbi:MAG TPA: response regulator, partial [Steroidobacteraceae bacterium]|nr:response regulator [Steroidobacteraceae bacterium]